LIKEGEEKEEGLTPLLNAPHFLIQGKGSLKVASPSLTILPLPFDKGKGEEFRKRG